MPPLRPACLALALAALPLIVAADPATVTADGVTLRSVAVSLPEGDRLLPGGAEAEAINANCLSCHSAGMITAQPKLSAAAWEAEVKKMRAVYKAPVADDDVPAILAYLAALPAARQP